LVRTEFFPRSPLTPSAARLEVCAVLVNDLESLPVADQPAIRNRTGWGRWLVLAATIALGIWAIRHFQFQTLLQSLLERISGFGLWAPIVFILAYILATVLLIPGSVLTLGAGAAFGFGWGLVWVTLGANLGAHAAFLIGRYFARAWVARKIAGHAGFSAIDQAVAKEGWKIVALTRLSPAFPFTFLNYAFGLTRVSFRHYALATFFGMMPGTVLYVYLGALAQAGIKSEGRTPSEWTLLIAGLMATLAVTVFVTRLARRALAKKVEPATN
jgi:uncharacterized membrane protein YdjX (TVP38/TMEM64 family)